MDIYSPGDCFVETVIPSAHVKADTRLITLVSPVLDRLQERLETFSRMLDIQERQLKDGRRDEQKRANEGLLQELKKQLELATKTRDHVQGEYRLGVNDITAVWQSDLELSLATAQAAKQETVVAQFDRTTADLNDRVAAYRSSVKTETSLLADFKKRLSILAPADGDFDAHCAKGLFYKKGQLLAVLA